MRYHLRALITLLSLCSGLLPGCSISRLTTAKLTTALTNENSTVFTGEEDVDLARDALPFTMKLYETMLQRDTNNVPLLLATGKLFALYAQAFVLFPADTLASDRKSEVKIGRMRAKRFFLRSREYLMKAISIVHPGAVSSTGKVAIDSLLTHVDRADTALLYWGASAWLGAIAADRSDLALAMTVKQPVKMLQKLCMLDSGYGLGAAHEMLSVCAAVTPDAIGGGAKTARFQFDVACKSSEGKKVSPYLSFATSWCIKTGDRDEFIRLLQQALAVDPNGEPSLRLQNMINRRRAQWYLDHTDRFFPGIAASNSISNEPVVGVAPEAAPPALPAATPFDSLGNAKTKTLEQDTKK